MPSAQRAPSRPRRQLPPPARSRRARLVPPHAAALVPRARTIAAVARDERSVPHPGLRGDAAADAGGSRAAEVPRVAGEVPVARSTRRRRRVARHRDLAAARLQHPAATPADDRPRIGQQARRTAASRRGDAARRSRDWDATPSAPSGASRSASAPPSSTPTWRVCCSACSSRAAIRRRTRWCSTSGACRRPYCLERTSSISTRL